MERNVHRTRALLFVLAGATLLTLPSGPVEAATTFTVNESGDARDRTINGVCDSSRERGRQCTLRAAIQEANATANSEGPDAIAFNISGTAAVKTISPARPLPAVTGAVTIDGYTQGSKTAASDDAKPNDNLFGEGSDAVIKVRLNGAKAGAQANGLKVTASGSTIKGLVINNFARNGVLIEGAGATGNKIEGSFIGTNAPGTQAAPNAKDGVRISGAPGNTVGGTEPAQSNVVSGNSGDGVEIAGGGATGNSVERNYVGADASGTRDLGNSLDGVRVEGAPDNAVGGASNFLDLGNLLVGNDSDGVALSGTGATGNLVAENVIGKNTGAARQLGNSAHGVRIEGGASGNTVGSTAANSSLANTIVGNGGDGVFVGGGTGNRILANTFGDNTGLGIDLTGGTESNVGVTANDEDDTDTGPNDLQNFPVLTSVVYDPSNGHTVYTGTLSSTPNQTFTIQFWGNVNIDPSDHGEGGEFLGQLTVTTDDQGEASFSAGGPPPSDFTTATATNTATGNTSEFSENVLLTRDE